MIKKIKFAIYCFTLFLFLTGCAGEASLNNRSPSPEGLKLSTETLRLKVGEEVRLTASMIPKEAEQNLIIWESFNQSIAFVNQNGHVEARALGITTIIARSGNLVSAVEIFVGYPIQFYTYGGTPIEPFWHYQNRLDFLPTPTKRGHSFLGWYTEPNFETAFRLETPLSEAYSLHALWEIDSYAITFYEDTDLIFEIITDNYDRPLELPQDPQKKGHTFKGWYTDLTFENQFDLITMPAEDLDLFAKWEINQYTLTYQTDHPFVQISTDIWSSIYLSQNGDIYFGGNQTENILRYINFRENEKIIDVFSGSVHQAIITSHGRIFKWGFNGNGEFGNGSFVSSQIPGETTPNFNFSVNEEIKEISLGYLFSSLLTSTGRVFMWGFNQSGQLGNGNETNQSIPNDITSRFNLNSDELIIQISVGWDHTMALSNEGRVFTWGNNPNGELGLSPVLIRYMNTPVDITSNFDLWDDETISQISSGRNHNAVLTSLNRVFTWGDNGLGNLGDGTRVHSFLPVEITNNFDLNENELVVSLHAGGFHSGALSNQGRLFTWGHNSYGQVGDGTTTSQFLPLDITPNFDFYSEETILKMSGGWSHSVVLTSKGRVFEWGKIDYAYNSESDEAQLSPRDITSQLLGVSFFLNEKSLNFDTTIDPLLPTKEGYLFSGWYLNEDLTEPFDFINMPAENLYLYARWIPVN